MNKKKIYLKRNSKKKKTKRHKVVMKFMHSKQFNYYPNILRKLAFASDYQNETLL